MTQQDDTKKQRGGDVEASRDGSRPVVQAAAMAGEATMAAPGRAPMGVASGEATMAAPGGGPGSGSFLESRDVHRLDDTQAASGEGTLLDSRDLMSVRPAGSGGGASRGPWSDARSGGARYERGAVFASGGMGAIRAAYDRVLARTVALKELKGELPRHYVERFVREAKLTGELQHPGIVPVHDFGLDEEGKPFYCMKLVKGRTLEEVMGEAKTYEARLALLPHMVSVAEALAFAHERRVVHRDLKPGNVLVGEFGETVVIDWGLAKRLSRGASGGSVAEEQGEKDEEGDDAAPNSVSEDPELTSAGSLLGTVSYMAPEQASGGEVTCASDVYALGVMLYRLLTGQSPYSGTTTIEVLQEVMKAEYADIRVAEEKVAEDLATVVRRCMRKDPKDRYETAGELLKDLKAFVEGRLVGSYEYSSWELFRRWVAKNRATLSVVAVAASVLSMSLGYSYFEVTRERDAARASRDRAEAASAAEREAKRLADLAAKEASRLNGVAARTQTNYGFQHVEARQYGAAVKLLLEAYELSGGAPTDENLATRIILASALSKMAQSSIFAGKSRFVGEALVSPDGQRVVIADDRGDVRVYDLASGAEVDWIPAPWDRAMVVSVVTDDSASTVAVNYDTELHVDGGSINVDNCCVWVESEGSVFGCEDWSVGHCLDVSPDGTGILGETQNEGRTSRISLIRSSAEGDFADVSEIDLHGFNDAMFHGDGIVLLGRRGELQVLDALGLRRESKRDVVVDTGPFARLVRRTAPGGLVVIDEFAGMTSMYWISDDLGRSEAVPGRPGQVTYAWRSILSANGGDIVLIDDAEGAAQAKVVTMGVSEGRVERDAQIADAEMTIPFGGDRLVVVGPGLGTSLRIATGAVIASTGEGVPAGGTSPERVLLASSFDEGLARSPLRDFTVLMGEETYDAVLAWDPALATQSRKEASEGCKFSRFHWFAEGVVIGTISCADGDRVVVYETEDWEQLASVPGRLSSVGGSTALVRGAESDAGLAILKIARRSGDFMVEELAVPPPASWLHPSPLRCAEAAEKFGSRRGPISEDGRYVAAYCDDGRYHVWDVASSGNFAWVVASVPVTEFAWASIDTTVAGATLTVVDRIDGRGRSQRYMAMRSWLERPASPTVVDVLPFDAPYHSVLNGARGWTRGAPACRPGSECPRDGDVVASYLAGQSRFEVLRTKHGSYVVDHLRGDVQAISTTSTAAFKGWVDVSDDGEFLIGESTDGAFQIALMSSGQVVYRYADDESTTSRRRVSNELDTRRAQLLLAFEDRIEVVSLAPETRTLAEIVEDLASRRPDLVQR